MLLTENRKEKAQVVCNVRAVKKKYQQNNIKTFSLDPNIKWNGMIEIMPTKFEDDPNNLGGVIQTLNSMNQQIIDESHCV